MGGNPNMGYQQNMNMGYPQGQPMGYGGQPGMGMPGQQMGMGGPYGGQPGGMGMGGQQMSMGQPMTGNMGMGMPNQQMMGMGMPGQMSMGMGQQPMMGTMGMPSRPPTMGGGASGDWVITPDERLGYEKQFVSIGAVNGKITGNCPATVLIVGFNTHPAPHGTPYPIHSLSNVPGASMQ